jgi:hypothetical protein
MEVFSDIIQGTPEWYEARMGVPTASMFTEVMRKPGPRGGIPKTRTTYLHKLAGEILTGEPMAHYSNDDMARGQEREAEARDLYAMIKDVEPIQVGFIRNGNCGCSPDALINADGMWENKDALPHIQIERLLKGILPTEHKTQCQGQLMAAQRQWLDFSSYCRGLPPLIVRVERDEKFIAELRIDIDEFVDELNALVAKIRSM